MLLFCLNLYSCAMTYLQIQKLFIWILVVVFLCCLSKNKQKKCLHQILHTRDKGKCTFKNNTKQRKFSIEDTHTHTHSFFFRTLSHSSHSSHSISLNALLQFVVLSVPVTLSLFLHYLFHYLFSFTFVWLRVPLAFLERSHVKWRKRNTYMYICTYSVKEN